MLVYLTVLNLLNYLDRYLLAALLPAVKADFQLTYAEGGTLISAFVVGYVLCSPLFGYLGDRFSRPLLMGGGVILWSIATALSGMASGFWQMYMLRVLVGVGEGSFATLAPGFIKDRCTDALQVNRRLTIFFIAIPVGSALGYVLAGVVSQFFSWHYAFFFGAVPGLLLSLYLFRLPESKTSRQATIPDSTLSITDSLKTILGVPALRIALLGYSFQSFALNGIASFITSLGVERGYTEESIAQIFGMILVVTGLLGTYLGGRLSSAGIPSHALSDATLQHQTIIKRLFLFLGASTFIAVPFLAAAFLIGDRVMFLVAAGFAELLIFAGTAPVNSIIVLSAPRGLQGLTQGVTITTINLFGAFLGPLAVGKLADLSTLAVGLQLTTLALFIAGVVWFNGRTAATA